MTAKVSYFPGVLPPEAAAPAEAEVAAPADAAAHSEADAAGTEAGVRKVPASVAAVPEAPESARVAPVRWVVPAPTVEAASIPAASFASAPPAAPEAKPLPTVWWNEEEASAAEGDEDDEAAFEDEPMSEGERAAFLENIVVRALARKGLSEWEISRLLTTNGVEEHELEPFLERYRDNRYIDDFDLAQTLVESLHRRKGFGRSQIKNELSSRHIQPEIVSAALEALDDDDEQRRATELAEKRAPSLARLDAATAERRLTSFLMRKGYPSGIVRAAVSAALTPQSRGVRFR